MVGRDLGRRIGAIEARLDYLDKHGTRGIEAVRAAQLAQAEGLGEIKARILDVSLKVDAMRTGAWRRVAAFGVAIAPIYALLFLAAFTARPGG
jgi:hypothetical protein